MWAPLIQKLIASILNYVASQGPKMAESFTSGFYTSKPLMLLEYLSKERTQKVRQEVLIN